MLEPAPTSERTSVTTVAGRARILVIDDSSVSRAYIVQTLAKLEQAETTAVDSGAHALRALRETRYALVLCDYEMPDMSGLQVLRFVRTKYSALELPVLLLTASDDQEIKLRAFRAGANDYIAKRAQPEELLARVSTQLELLEAQRRVAQAQLRQAEGQKFEAMGHLADALAHELNTPAQYVADNLGFLGETFQSLKELLDGLRASDQPLSPAALDARLAEIDYDYLCQEIPRCVAHAQEGIAHVARNLALIRGFAQGGAHEVGPQDINEIVRGAATLTRIHWHELSDLTLELDPTLPRVPCLGATVKQLVLQILMHAISTLSAVKGSHGRGQLRLRTSQDAQFVSISLIASGHAAGDALGSDPDESAVDAGASRANQGLSRVRAAVEEHGGALEVARAAGDETSISLRLPLRR